MKKRCGRYSNSILSVLLCWLSRSLLAVLTGTVFVARLSPPCITFKLELELRVADRDIIAFKALKNSPEVSLVSSCFFAQQAIEKCLKAVLFERGITVTPIHDLARLVVNLQEHGLNAPYSADELRKLNPFAVIFRYDDTDIPLISVVEVDKMVDAMRHWAGEIIS